MWRSAAEMTEGDAQTGPPELSTFRSIGRTFPREDRPTAPTACRWQRSTGFRKEGEFAGRLKRGVRRCSRINQAIQSGPSGTQDRTGGTKGNERWVSQRFNSAATRSVSRSKRRHVGIRELAVTGADGSAELRGSPDEGHPRPPGASFRREARTVGDRGTLDGRLWGDASGVEVPGAVCIDLVAFIRLPYS